MCKAVAGGVRGTYPLSSLRDDPGFQVRMRTTDLAVCNQVYHDQQYAYMPPQAIRCIVDAGANIGCSAVYFAKKFPEARIICIEADKSNYEVLRINCARYPNIECLHAALWPVEGQVEVVDTGEGEWAFRAKEIAGSEPSDSQGNQRIEAITIDGVMSRFGLETIDVLKMDIEGGEREVLGAGERVLDRVNVLAVECHDRWVPGCTRVVFAATRNFSYEWVQWETLFFCREGWLPPGFQKGRYGIIPRGSGSV